MANMNIEGTLGSMFKGMDGFISSKSVVGEPVYVGDTILIPLVDVNFGMAAGAFNKQDGNKAAGGIGEHTRHGHVDEGDVLHRLGDLVLTDVLHGLQRVLR